MRVYESADRFIVLLDRRTKREFAKTKSRFATFDEINVFEFARKLAEKIKSMVFLFICDLADEVYTEMYEKPSKEKVEKIARTIVSGYDPVTTVRFDNEIDRQMQRLAEGILSAEENHNKSGIIDRSMRSVTGFANWQLIRAEDEARRTAYEDMSVKYVIWHSEHDERVCGECESLDGEIFPISKVPIKPHKNCRCWITSAVREDDNRKSQDKT